MHRAETDILLEYERVRASNEEGRRFSSPSLYLPLVRSLDPQYPVLSFSFPLPTSPSLALALLASQSRRQHHQSTSESFSMAVCGGFLGTSFQDVSPERLEFVPIAEFNGSPRMLPTAPTVSERCLPEVRFTVCTTENSCGRN